MRRLTVEGLKKLVQSEVRKAHINESDEEPGMLDQEVLDAIEGLVDTVTSVYATVSDSTVRDAVLNAVERAVQPRKRDYGNYGRTGSTRHHS